MRGKPVPARRGGVAEGREWEGSARPLPAVSMAPGEGTVGAGGQSARRPSETSDLRERVLQPRMFQKPLPTAEPRPALPVSRAVNGEAA